MKAKLLRSAAAMAIALTLSQPASADAGRVVVVPFEFYGMEAGATPAPNEDHVGITVVDSQGQPVSFTVQQDGNPGFAGGCGTLQWGTLSADGLFPINGSGPGGTPAGDVVVFPWVGPDINNILDPGGTPCITSPDLNLILPGETGTVTFVFHDHSA